MALAPKIDLDVAVSTFENTHADYLAEVVDRYTHNPHRTHPRAGFAMLLLGALRSLQERQVEAAIDGILRLGSRRIRLVSTAPEGNLSAEPGSLAIMDDGSAVYKKASGSGNTGWVLFGAGTFETAWELDWAAQSSLDLDNDLAGPTEYAVGGLAVRVDNADGADSINVTNGSGLVIAATGGASRDWDKGDDDAPGVSLILGPDADEIAVPSQREPITFWWYLSAYSTPNSNNYIFCGLTTYTGGGYSELAVGGGFKDTWAMQKENATEQFSVVDTSTHNVIALRLTGGSMMDVYSGVWSSGWPDLDAMTLVGHNAVISGNRLSTTHILRRPGVLVTTAVATGGTTGAPSCTVARQRITVG